LALGWFGALLAVEFLARQLSPGSVVPWLICGIALGALDLFLRPSLGRRAVALSWGAAAIGTALFVYFMGPQLGAVWSVLVEPLNASHGAIYAAFLSCACLLCILIGNLPLLRRNSKGYAGLLAIFLVISAGELALHFQFANLALAGAVAVFVQQRIR
jgi:hypothetical protein